MRASTMASIPGDPSVAIIRDPLVVSPQATVLDAIAQMRPSPARRSPEKTTAHLSWEPHRPRSNGVVVVENQQVVGIFTPQDLVCLTLQQRPLAAVTISEVMTQPVVSLQASDFTDLWVATQRLQQHQIRHLPLLNERGELVGLVTHESLQQAIAHQQLQTERLARAEAEARFRASEQQYASLLAAAPVGIFRTDAVGHCIYVNECWSQIVGLPLAAALGEGWQQGLHPEDREPVFMAWQQATINQQPFQLEYRFQHQDGTVRWVKGQAIAETDDQGQITGYVGTITDITESKRLEAERQQSERTLAQSAAHQRAIIQAIPDLIVRVNRAGIVQEFLTSPNFRILGNLTDWVGTHLSDQLPPQIAQQRLVAIDQALTSQTIQIYEQDLSIEGTTQIEEVRVVPYGEDEVLLLVRDISDRKRLEAEGQQAQAALREGEARWQFALEGAGDGIWDWNAQTNQVFYSLRWKTMLGYTADEVGDRLADWETRVHPDDQAHCQTELSRHFRGEIPTYQTEHRMRCKDGSYKWVLARGQVIQRSDQGQPLRMIGTHTDISDRKQAEAALQNLIQGTAATTGRDFFPALVSHIAETLKVSFVLVTERVGEELRTLGFWADGALQPTYIYGAVHTPCERVLKGGEFYCDSSVQQRFPLDPDLVEMGVESYLGIALQGSEGEVVGHLCVLSRQPLANPQRATQILRVFAARTAAELERQQATTALEQLNQTLEATVAERTTALQASEAQLRAMIEAIPDLLLRVTPEGTCLGSIYPSGDSQDFLPIQRHLSEVLPPELLQQQLNCINRAVATGAVQIYEHQFQKGDRMVYEEVRVSAISPDQVLLMVRDATQRKQIEKALHESQRFLQTVLDTVPMPIFWKDRNSVFLGGTQKLLDAVGLQSEADLIGKTDFDLAATQAQAIAYRADDQQVMASGIARLGIVETLTGSDGQQIWLETHKAPLRDWAGEVVGVVGIFQDITQRKWAEIALQESEARYRSIYDQTAMGLVNATLSGQLLQVNPRFCEMLGYSQAELIGKTIQDITHPDDRGQIAPDMQRLFAGDIAHFFQEKRYLRKDGSHFWSSTGVSIVRDALGKPVHTLAVIRDISDRKQAEMALQIKTEELDRFFALALDLLCIVDNEGRFIRLNHQWEQTLGYPLAEMRGSGYMDYVHPEDVDRTLAASSQLTENKSLSNFANRYRCRDGSYRWLEWQSVLSQGLIYATARDITDRKRVDAELKAKTNEIQQAYQDLQAAQLQLVQSEKMSSLGQLVAGIAHEINNPVSFIYGNLSIAFNYAQDLRTLLALYQDHYTAPPQAITDFIKAADINYVLEDFLKLLKSMENGAVRIRDIVASLRTFSRLDQSALKATDIHENIDSTLVILQNRLNGRAGKPEIQVVKAYGDLPQIECYSGLLNQVFMNLLVNAVDAIEERQATASPDYAGCITIETQRTVDQVRVAVKDNGTGMDAETQAHIFDPFFTTKPVGLGTGMGLSISYQIVTGNHQGQLSCQSVPGEGTAFRLDLWQVLSPAKPAEVSPLGQSS